MKSIETTDNLSSNQFAFSGGTPKQLLLGIWWFLKKQSHCFSLLTAPTDFCVKPAAYLT